IPDGLANSFQCKFLDGPGSSAVNVTADDLESINNTGDNPHVVGILNVAPTVAFTAGSTTVDEGVTAHTYSYSISDPGVDTVSSVAVSCGPRGALTISPTDALASSCFQCQFLGGPASPAVTVQAADSYTDAGSAATRPVAVNNVAPTVA